MFVMVRLSRNWEHKIIIIFFSGLNCWLNFGDIILLFYSFFGGGEVYLFFSILFSLFRWTLSVSGGTVPRWNSRLLLHPRSIWYGKKAVKPRVRKRKQIHESIFFFLFFLSFLVLSYPVLLCWWTVAFWFYFFLVLFYYWISFTTGNFYGSL